jgi:hypothetical protein
LLHFKQVFIRYCVPLLTQFRDVYSSLINKQTRYHLAPPKTHFQHLSTTTPTHAPGEFVHKCTNSAFRSGGTQGCTRRLRAKMHMQITHFNTVLGIDELLLSSSLPFFQLSVPLSLSTGTTKPARNTRARFFTTIRVGTRSFLRSN